MRAEPKGNHYPGYLGRLFVDNARGFAMISAWEFIGFPENEANRSVRRSFLEKNSCVGEEVVNTAVIGAQWGDEGKGKVVDVLARSFEYVVRFQGGPNAGHSVVFGGDRFALHVLPSGIFHPTATNIIANGVVVDPVSLVKEIKGLSDKGIQVDPSRLKISDRAHIIMPYHGIVDRHKEASNSEKKIGTTGRGIGPTYEAKVGRRGIRFCDLNYADYFWERAGENLAQMQASHPDCEALRQLTVADMKAQIQEALDFLHPFVTDTTAMLARVYKEKRSILFEGAQATLLDVDFGTYPYVTSSNSSAAGINAGCGLPPRAVDRTVGIFKAYATRVGEGPFPTELDDAVGESIRKAGHEFGTTTGRPRRCGWLDLVALRYTVEINGFDTLCIMKLDCLDHLQELFLCESYEIGGKTIETVPASAFELAAVTPRYRRMEGWNTSLENIREFDALPESCRTYLRHIEDYLDCPIGIVSVGPDREQTIVRDPALAKALG